MVKVKFTTTITEDLLKEMKVEAIRKDCGVNDIIEDLFKKDQKEREIKGEENERRRI